MTDQVERLSDSWDAHAHEWIKWVRAPGRQDSYWRFHRERFLSLVPTAGRLTVDIGCGEGRVGRDLQDLGHRVLGIDLSFTMCRAAMTHAQPSPAVRADAAELPLAESSADCAIAFMSLQDIDDMQAVVKEIARVLEDDSLLVLAIVHPMYSGGKFSRIKLSRAGRNYKPFVIKRSYFQTKRLVSTDVHGGLRVTLFREHRPLQAYIQALIDAGFNIEKLVELTDADQARHREGIPVFLDILARLKPREKQADSAQDFGAGNGIDAEFQALDRDYGNREKYSPFRLPERSPLPVSGTDDHKGRWSIPVAPMLIVSGLVGLVGLVAAGVGLVAEMGLFHP